MWKFESQAGLALLALIFSFAAHAGSAFDQPYDPHWWDYRAFDGHSIQLLPDGASLTAARIELIQNARSTIYIAGFAYDPDQAGMEIANLLCDKAKQGLDVRLFLDHRGSSDFGDEADRLRKCGARVFFYDPLDWGIDDFRETLHEKLLIVDGEHVITGGSGYSNKYKEASFDSPEWHDLDVEISGPAACWYHARFVREWKQSAAMEVNPDWKIYQDDYGQKILERIYGLKSFRSCKYVKFGSAKVYPLQQNPFFESGRWLLKTHINAIRASTKTIRVYSPYFIPHKDYIKALLEARARGVEVEVLTNSFQSTDEKTTPMAMIFASRKLLKAGVKVYLWGKTSMLHRKGGVYDGKWAYFGSDNRDRAADVYNSEDIAITDDPQVVSEMQKQMDMDFAVSRRLTREYIDEQISTAGFWKRLELKIIRKYL